MRSSLAAIALVVCVSVGALAAPIGGVGETVLKPLNRRLTRAEKAALKAQEEEQRRLAEKTVVYGNFDAFAGASTNNVADPGAFIRAGL